MSAPADCPVSPFEQYGLRLVEEPSLAEPSPRPCAEPSSAPLGLGPFHWSLLAGFAAFELGYLGVWALVARWAVHRLIGA